MIELNDVAEQVIVKEFCDEQELLSLPTNIRALIISDCEGYELELFQDKVINHLNNSDFIIESHDGYDRKISKQLIDRFKKTHYVRVIQQKKRRKNDFMLNMDCSDFMKLSAMDEGRGFWLRWLFIESKNQ